MSDFEPHSWEMPFDGTAQGYSTGRAIHCLAGADVECQLYVIPSDHQARNGGGESRKIPLFSLTKGGPEGNFVACNGNSTSPIYTRYDHAIDPIALIEEFAQAWGNDKIARLFWLSERGELRQAGEVACESLLVTTCGIAVWRNYVRPGGSSAFSWASPSRSGEFARIPSLDLWGHIQQLLEEPRSEADFARRFNHLDFDTKRAMIFNWSRGDSDEFNAVLRDILLSHDIWDEVTQSDELKLTVRTVEDVDITFEDLYAVWGVDTPPSLLQAVEHLCEWFGPFNTEIVSRRCVRDWIPSLGMGLDVTAQRPTAHERLEAHIRWRDWLVKTQEAE